ncbi:MAG: hypothetical protein EBX52_02685 [Proteobacteria bacterium]|nr:hypothetical protein [Pseudomonadota bacterium]
MMILLQILIWVPDSVFAGKRCNDLSTQATRKPFSIVQAFRDESLLEGDLQYLTVPATDTGKSVDWVRVVGFEREKGKKRVVILYPDGSLALRDEAWIKKAHPSPEAKAVWLGFDYGGSLLLAKKEVGELPLKREQWIARALGLESVPPLDRSKARTFIIDDQAGKALDSSAGKGPIAKLGEALKQKMNVIMAAIEPVEDEYCAVYRGDATIVDEDGTVRLDQKTIQMKNEVLESGRVSDTLLHEIGHAKTFQNLAKGIPDPLGVGFEALSGKKPLPDGTHYGINEEDGFYSEFSSADESRQYALNLRNALHQRATSDVIRDFSVNPSIPASKVYGFNLQNFFEMYSEALDRIEDLRIFNRRNRELATLAVQKLEKILEHPGNLKISDFEVFSKLGSEPAVIDIRTGGAFVQVPVVGEAYDRILAPIEFHSEGEIFFNFALRRESIPEIFAYSLEYLRNLVRAMERQAVHIEKVLPQVIDFGLHPSKPVTLREYLEFESEVAKVRTSVAVKPKWLGKLRSMVEKPGSSR